MIDARGHAERGEARSEARDATKGGARSDAPGNPTKGGARAAEPGDADQLRALAGYERLLAELFAREPDEETLALAAEVPELAPYARPDAAAQHTHVFVLNVYPFATVFLDPEGGLDGGRAAFTRDVLRALGFTVADGVPADHAAVTLEALATLLEREAEATQPVEVERARHAQATLLIEHLLPWAPSLLAAVERVDDGLYGAAARLARQVLIEHASRIAVPANVEGVPEGDGAAAPEADRPPQPGTDHATQTKAEDAPKPREDAAALAWLATPARCGMYLSRADVTVLAGRVDLPVRFGGRRFMLESLARGAREQQRDDDLREAMVDFAMGRRGELDEWARWLPALTAVWEPMAERLERTLARLQDRGP